MKNAISWFEIPAIDINRAQQFYETIFQIKLIRYGFWCCKNAAIPD